ncbi:MAG: hypothetical protein M3M86_04700, partial [Thermoproteota archaeon]|nr:hypothetical protein [Thermoproteota archaeon]
MADRGSTTELKTAKKKNQLMSQLAHIFHTIAGEIQIKPMGRSCSMSASKKPHMNLVVTGHVDNGKS